MRQSDRIKAGIEKKFTVLWFALILFSVFLAMPSAAVTLKVEGTYGQTEARNMLSMINSFRKSSDAWYWNEENTEKVVCSGLKDLKYDARLETAAMLRAVEIAVVFSHNRPDGTSCFSVDANVSGENIACGQVSAEDVMEDWKEENEKYDGQGHRRCMLNSTFDAVGIGHVVVNGVHCWVQEFGQAGSAQLDAIPNDTKMTRSVEVLDSAIKQVYLFLTSASGDISYTDLSDWTLEKDSVIDDRAFQAGVYVEVPDPMKSGETDRTEGSFMGKSCVPVVTDFEVQNSDPSVAVVENGDLKGLKVGKTDFSVKLGNVTGKVSVTVDPIKLSDAEDVEIKADNQTFNGKEHTPELTVTVYGKKLTRGTDYTASFKNNVNTGKASVKITGKGDYTGSRTGSFEIEPADLGKAAAIKEIPDQLSTGTGICPDVTVTWEGSVLAKDTDYTVTYSENVRAGAEAKVTVTGQGNFKGTVEGSFKITPRQSAAKGKKLRKGNGYYVVTKAGGSETAEAAFVKPVKASKKTITIPDTILVKKVVYKVTGIKARALLNNKAVTKVVIGTNVSSIGKAAFQGCKNVQKIVIYSTKLKKAKIGVKAFYKINPKAKIRVPKKKLSYYTRILKTGGLAEEVRILS